ncbi:MAG: YbaB/EbfC family nucleoid-associated protein [Chloroflexota bacterium]|nr:YbaB/EbfC family nucleoid-associated protein [Chloroflexota bacterium]
MARRRGPGQMNNLMRQVQKMQADVQRAQEEAEKQVLTVSAGGGAVEVTITGGLVVQAITIKPEVVDPEDVEMLQDLILAAVNEAIQKSQDTMGAQVSSVTGDMLGGLGIPGL